MAINTKAAMQPSTMYNFVSEMSKNPAFSVSLSAIMLDVTEINLLITMCKLTFLLYNTNFAIYFKITYR